jgi:hypothetical protein
VGKKSPSRELGGLGWGFLIVETKTHPVIVDITTNRRIRFLPSPESKNGPYIVAR